ncbi:uncharacterized protein LOC121423139 [Lytechinus variegatus]|uniref:uncharacterized protein LOC121423139 n=1 Tax=Lytechinus variegatus TaxID=7654 RepID=UPI001BB29BD6|nr:uncharacterized protein LOC121423139 [Lytechinus variegatus]
MLLGERVFYEEKYKMDESNDGKSYTSPDALADDVKKPSPDQRAKLKYSTEAFTIENGTCCMNNVAQFMMTGWSTVLIAMETSTNSRMYVSSLVFNLFTWVLTVIMIIMIIIRRRTCAGKVLRQVEEEWPEERMNKTKRLQRISFRLSMMLVALHIISMVVTSVHISGVVENKSRNTCALTGTESHTHDTGEHLSNSTTDT